MHAVAPQFKGNGFSEILLMFPCSQKILMKTDSNLDFGTNGFGLSAFVTFIAKTGI